MDEPTNDLDLPTLRLLEESLMDFGGCVAVVSHDRYFLNRVCTHILAFEGDGRIFFQPGDYQYYLEKRDGRRALERAEPPRKEPSAAPSSSAKQVRKPRLSWKEQRELEGMEESILAAEERVSEIESIFADANFHAKYGSRTSELTAELESAKRDVEAKYQRWQELLEKSQAAGA